MSNNCKIAIRPDKHNPTVYVLDTLDLKTREWTCPVCGTKHNRDLNASINICRVGISTLSIDGVKPQLAEVTFALKPESL